MTTDGIDTRARSKLARFSAVPPGSAATKGPTMHDDLRYRTLGSLQHDDDVDVLYYDSYKAT